MNLLSMVFTTILALSSQSHAFHSSTISRSRIAFIVPTSQQFQSSTWTVLKSAADENSNGGAEPDGEDGNYDPLAKLMEIPEFSELLQSKKMRECMQLLMEGGQEALEQKMKEDKEVEEMAMMLNQ